MTSGKKWLKAMWAQHDFGPQELELAKLAAEQLDIAENARRGIKKHGSVVKARYGLAPNPAIDIARKASESYSRLVKALKAAGEPKRHVGRPSLSDVTWKQSQAETKKSDKPDEWADFDLPKAKPQ